MMHMLLPSRCTQCLRSVRSLSFIAFLLPLLVGLPRTATAQDHCDSLHITSVYYHPFFDTLLNVQCENTGTHFFSGPQFQLVSQQGDTLAHEPFEFFGIGTGQQTHHLIKDPEDALPTTPFTGSLVLFSASMEGPDTCTYEVVAEDLCSLAPCTPLNVYVYSFGSAGEPFNADFTWQVHDALHATVASGTLAISVFGEQQAFADLCLPPGQYELHMQQAAAVGVHYAFGVTQDGDVFTNNGPNAVLEPGGEAIVPFNYYMPCIDAGNAIDEVRPRAPAVQVADRMLHLASASGLVLDSFAIVDAAGHVVLTHAGRSTHATLDLSAHASGVYLVRSIAGEWPAQRFVLP